MLWKIFSVFFLYLFSTIATSFEHLTREIKFKFACAGCILKSALMFGGYWIVAELAVGAKPFKICPQLFSCFFIYSRLSISRSRRAPLKHFVISVLRHIRFAELRIKTTTTTKNQTTKFHKWTCNLTPLVRNIYYCIKSCAESHEQHY